MQRLIRAPSLTLAQLWVDLLCQAGYPACVERRFLSSIVGELPPDESLPEIWLTHPEHEAAARQLLTDWAHAPQRCWTCPRCGEHIDGGFEQCWNCSALMPS